MSSALPVIKPSTNACDLLSHLQSKPRKLYVRHTHDTRFVFEQFTDGWWLCMEDFQLALTMGHLATQHANKDNLRDCQIVFCQGLYKLINIKHIYNILLPPMRRIESVCVRCVGSRHCCVERHKHYFRFITHTLFICGALKKHTLH